MYQSKQPTLAPAPKPVASKPWHVQLGDLLAQAAELSVQNGLDVDALLKAAWSAYVDAHPGFRDHLEELHLRTQLDELRKLGRIGEA